MDDHLFLSNFCWHDLHTHCKDAWSKCEVCEAVCLCDCHQTEGETPKADPLAQALTILTE